ncbi:MAG: phosphoglycerate kinase [bacterium]|jgi:phosphoglycerate kinase
MAKKTIDKIDVKGKRVLIRVDFNVPIEDGKITDERRIREALPTIKSVLERGGAVVLMSHLGRPSGKGYEAEYSLKPVATKLSELLGRPVAFPSTDLTDAAAEAATKAAKPGDVVLLENVRFAKGEKKGDADYASKLAGYGDVYCNDAFGTAHREDGSMFAVPKAMAGKPRVAGLLLQKELVYLGDKLSNPAKPFCVILGGAKVSDKIELVENLLPRADSILIGGAMAYTFLAALGRKVGASRVEHDHVASAKKMLDQAAQLKCDLHLPMDHVCSTEFHEMNGEKKTFTDHIGEGFMGLDIGPKTQQDYAAVIRKSKTIVWNGPMGVFEWFPFAVGTRMVAESIVKATEAGATSIVGGGDSAAAAEQFGLASRFSHVSTGGGASLEMLAGKPFTTVALLDEA